MFYKSIEKNNLKNWGNGESIRLCSLMRTCYGIVSILLTFCTEHAETVYYSNLSKIRLILHFYKKMHVSEIENSALSLLRVCGLF